MECVHCASRPRRIMRFLERIGMWHVPPYYEMTLQDTVHDFHDPADRYGHGQITGKVWVCPRCGHTEEWEPEEPDFTNSDYEDAE